MKRASFLLSILLIGAFAWAETATPPSTPEIVPPDIYEMPHKKIPAKIYNKEAVGATIRKYDETFKTLGFKGLHLMMAKKDVNDLVENTPWGYLNWPQNVNYDDLLYNDDWPDMPQEKDENALKKDRSRMDNRWLSFGCKGEGEREICYVFERAHISFYDGKLVKINLYSYDYSISHFEGSFKGWGNFALDALTSKYGRPKIAYIRPSDLTVLSFPRDQAMIASWEIGGERIEMAGLTRELDYYWGISYQNIRGLDALNKSRNVKKFDL